MVRIILIRAHIGLDLRGPYCFPNDHFFISNDRIFHCLNIPQNSPNLEYTSHLLKIFKIYFRPRCPPLGGTIIKETAFWLITRPFTPTVFSANSQNVANLLLQSPPMRFHQSAPNFAHTICGLSLQHSTYYITTSCTFCSKHKVLHISTLVCPNDISGDYFPMSH